MFLEGIGHVVFLVVFFLFLLNFFYFEIIVDLHTVLRNSMGGSVAPSFLCPPQ